MVELHWLAIFLAAASTMVIGSIWYGPLFGEKWQKLAKIKPDKNFTPKKAFILYGGAFLASLLTAIVIAYVAFVANRFFHNSFLQDAVVVSVVLWLGFTAARLYMHDSFEGRSRELTLLNIGHEFVTIAVMATIIGLFPQ
jgi:xanthine/uracil permease